MSWKDILKFDIRFLDDVKAWVIKHQDKISDEDNELFQEYVFNHASMANLKEFKRLAMKYPFYEEHMPFWDIQIKKSKTNRIFLPAFKEGVNNTVNRLEINGRVYATLEFYKTLREEYGNEIRKAMAAGTSPFVLFPSQHIKHKTEPEKIRGKLSVVMKSLGFTRKKEHYGDVYWER
jgi:hypothetical protein